MQMCMHRYVYVNVISDFTVSFLSYKHLSVLVQVEKYVIKLRLLTLFYLPTFLCLLKTVDVSAIFIFLYKLHRFNHDTIV